MPSPAYESDMFFGALAMVVAYVLGFASGVFPFTMLSFVFLIGSAWFVGGTLRQAGLPIFMGPGLIILGNATAQLLRELGHT